MRLIFFKFIALQLLMIPDISFSQQDSTSLPKEFYLTISSNLDDANVYIDSAFTGKTPLERYKLQEGVYSISIRQTGDSEKWKKENIIFNDFKIISDTTINADFSYFYFIRSTPFDASVFYRDTLLGFTPLRYFSQSLLSGNLLLKKEGYFDKIYDLSIYNFETGADITLQPKSKISVEEIVYKNRDTRFKTKRDFLPVIGFGAAALASGYSAVHFKNIANDAYDNYLRSPVTNSSELDRSNRNDVYSIISLAVMQLALAGVIYFLFLD